MFEFLYDIQTPWQKTSMEVDLHDWKLAKDAFQQLIVYPSIPESGLGTAQPQIVELYTQIDIDV